MSLKISEPQNELANLKEKLKKADRQRIKGEGFSLTEVKSDLDKQLHNLKRNLMK